MQRCPWANSHPLLETYHDREWGVWNPDRQHLFEMLTLEGVQAGLSWLLVLQRRDAYRQVFEGFQPEVAAAWSDADLAHLMEAPGLIHNRAKIRSHRMNAQAFLAVEQEFGGFEGYLRRVIEGEPRINRFVRADEVPTQTPESLRLSQDLTRRGFRFVGPTICYSFMQSVGLVQDHLLGCFRHGELAVTAPR